MHGAKRPDGHKIFHRYVSRQRGPVHKQRVTANLRIVPDV